MPYFQRTFEWRSRQYCINACAFTVAAEIEEMVAAVEAQASVVAIATMSVYCNTAMRAIRSGDIDRRIAHGCPTDTEAIDGNSALLN